MLTNVNKMQRMESAVSFLQSYSKDWDGFLDIIIQPNSFYSIFQKKCPIHWHSASTVTKDFEAASSGDHRDSKFFHVVSKKRCEELEPYVTVPVSDDEDFGESCPEWGDYQPLDTWKRKKIISGTCSIDLPDNKNSSVEDSDGISSEESINSSDSSNCETNDFFEVWEDFEDSEENSGSVLDYLSDYDNIDDIDSDLSTIQEERGPLISSSTSSTSSFCVGSSDSCAENLY
uniref:Uncharacterized protein n=1 Tax=Timema poppense TaxID=170557 RepID=A0A7R9H756_TIMPO|nr:unnamed protein product [Timema poppensis]